jgi:magnesium-transporting ATPase (P-type)
VTAAARPVPPGFIGSPADISLIPLSPLDAMTERDLDDLLGSGAEVIFARSSPEAKLRIADAMVMAGFFLALRHAGWYPGAPTGPGSPLNYAYRQATTVAWLGIVACQVGTAFAVRTDHASLRSVGVFTNRFLLAGIAVELAFAAAVIYLPALQGVFGTEALTPAQLAIVAPFPLIVWGADEIRRMLMRRYRTGRQRSSAD